MVSYRLAQWEFNVIDEHRQELWYRSSTYDHTVGYGIRMAPSHTGNKVQVPRPWEGTSHEPGGSSMQGDNNPEMQQSPCRETSITRKEKLTNYEYIM